MPNIRFIDNPGVAAFGEVTNVDTASFALTSVSSSFSSTAVTASHALFAVSASIEVTKEISSSHANKADTASFAQSGDGFFTGSFTGSFFGNGEGIFSGSFSGVKNAETASYITAENIDQPFTNITASSNISSSANVRSNISVGNTTGQLHVTQSTELVVKVDTQVPDHRYYDIGSANKYYINGLTSPYFNVYPGKKYKFNQNDSTNNNHPVIFYLDAARTTEYNTGVIYYADGIQSTSANYNTNFNAASVRYTEIQITDTTPSILYYQCYNHGYMGNAVYVQGAQQFTAASGSFSGSFVGNGSGLTSIPASGIVGLNLSQIASGSATASISPNLGLVVNTNVSSSATSTASFGTYLGDGSQLDGVQAFPFTGDAQITGSLTVSGSFLAFQIDSDDIVLGAGAGAAMRAGGNQSVSYNVLIGTNAGKYIDQYGTNNIAIGREAGTGDTVQSIGIGTYATHRFKYSKVGNIGIGYYALSNGGGTYGNIADGEYNTAIGHDAGRNICDGVGNTMLGSSAGRNLGGYNAGGDGNTAIGYYAGYNQTTGDGNITIGSGSLGVAGESNQLRIGNSNNFTLISGSLSDGGILIQGQVSASSYIGDGSQLTGVGGSTGAFGISNSSGEYTYYSSLSASMAAAVSGDVIEVFADTVISGSVALATTILFKNGVNIFGNGHTYTLDHSSSMAAFADFLEQNNTDATDISCSINEFNIRRISSDATSKAINIQNRTSGKQTSLNLHGSTIHNTAGLAFSANYRNASVDGGHFHSDIDGAAGFINAAGGADTHPYTKNVHCHFPNGWSSVSSVDNSQFISEGDQAYTLAVSGRVSNCYISSKGSGVAVYDSGTSSEILNCNIENSADGIAVRGFGFISNSTIYSNTSFAVRTFGNADCEIVNNRIYSKAYVALDQYTSYGGGRHNISNNTIISDISNTSYAAVQLQGANSNEFIFANNTVINNGDNANCHGIKLTNYDSLSSDRRTILANNTIKVFNTGANCISTTSAVTKAFLVGNIYDVASVAVHPLITQSFTNVPDEQGNIHLTSSLNNDRTYSGSFSGSYVGDGSQLTGLSSFPFTGSAGISGSLQVKGSGNTFATTPILIENSDGEDLIKVLNSGRFFIGKGASNAADSNVVYGNSANAQGSNNIAIGDSANAQGGTYNVAIGGTVANVSYGIGIGSAYIGGAESVGVGYSSRTSAGTVAIGHDSGPESAGDGEQSIYIGNEAKGTADNSIVLNANGGSTISSATETNSFKVFMSSASTPDFQVTNTHITSSGNVSGSATSTASFGHYIGDGSNLTGISTGTPTFIGSGSTSASADPNNGVVVNASGSTLFDVRGSLGSLFSVTDSFDGNLFEVNNISGISLLSVSSSGDVDVPKGNLTVSGSVSASKFLGDGSALTGVGGDPFPFTGDAQITGSLIISGSFNAFRMDSDDIILGNEAGQNFTHTGASYNVFIGERAGKNITSGGTNVIIGREAGAVANQGRNTSIGYVAGRGWSGTAGENVSVGYYAGYNAAATATGTQNTLLGAYSGRNLTTGKGNVYIGHSAGFNGTSSTGNIIIGSGSLGTSTYNVPINNQLRIGNGNFHIISGSLTTGDIILQGNVSSSATSTSSFGTYLGDGSQLTGVGGDAFPFTGDAQITGSLVISSSNSTASLTLEGSGSTIFSIQGSQGQLFSVTDDLLDEVFSVADISGDTLLSVSGSGLVTIPVGDLTGSATATASYGAFKGDGSQLTNLPASNPFPFTGDALISGSLELTGSLDVDLPDTGDITFTTRKGGFKVTSKDVGFGELILGPAGYNTGYSSIPGLFFNTDPIIRRYTASGGPISIGKNSGQYVTINKPGNFFHNLEAGLEVYPPTTSTLALLASGSVEIKTSGSTLFEVIGSEGTIFKLDDDLDGTLFTVNDRSGIPMFEVSASGRIVAEEGESIIRSQRPMVTHTADFSITSSLDFAGKYHIVNGALTCSVNTSSIVPAGAEFEFFQTSSAGNFLFITGGLHVDLIAKNDNRNLAGRGSGATLKYIGGSTFHLVGDLT